MVRFTSLILFSTLIFDLNLYKPYNFERPAVKTIKPNCGQVPELNKKIIAFVKSKINTTVGRGECWDLAAEALNTVNASWDKDFIFGREINVQNDCVYPGDIMQFENVTVEYSKGKTTYRERMEQHTAIIYEIRSDGDFMLADQNTTTFGRKVGLNPLNIKDIKAGKFHIYQPVKSVSDSR